MEYLEALEDAINKGYGCKSKHLKTVPTKLTHDGVIIWDGEVEVFEIIGHPKAKKCYGWGFEKEKGEIEFVTVLEILPVIDTETAVKAYLASQS